MFYAMRTIKDDYNPKLFHMIAARIKPFKTLEQAQKCAKKHPMGYVIDNKHHIVWYN